MAGTRPIEVLPLPPPDAAARFRLPLAEPTPGFRPRGTPLARAYLLADDRTLELHGTHGDLEQFAGVEVDEPESDVVRVRLVVADRHERPVTGYVTLEAYVFRTRVRLQRPLAGRRLLDVAAG